MGKRLTLAQIKHKVEQLARQRGLSLDSITSESVTAEKVDAGTIEGDEITHTGAIEPWMKHTSDRVGVDSFDTWRQPDEDKPMMVVVTASAETDGDSAANIRFRIDLSGGTSSDYRHIIAYQFQTTSGVRQQSTATVILPPGASYKIENWSDPNGTNTLFENREIVL